MLDLVFKDGQLTNAKLVNGGSGYDLAAAAAENNNAARSTTKLVVPINCNIEESQYLVRNASRYNDWYIMADSQSFIEVIGVPRQRGQLRLTVSAKSGRARSLLSGGLQPTTGYSGNGQQRFSVNAQAGSFAIFQNGAEIARGEVKNHEWLGWVDSLPDAGDRLIVKCDGDSTSSYNVNFKPSTLDAVLLFKR